MSKQLTYNGIRVPETINPALIASAFCNPVNENKIWIYANEMREKMLSHEFPAIEGFPRLITQDDVDNEVTFLNGRQVEESQIGKIMWFVTNGHHRSYAAIEAGLPYFPVELDYSTITDEEELKQFK